MPVFPFFIRASGFALLTLLSDAQAQEAPLRLSDVLARTAERNPALLAQAYSERSAEALIEQAGYRPNPTVDVMAENFAGTGALQGVRRLEATVQASQAIERGSKREKRVAAASRDRDIASRQLGVRRAELLAAAAIAYVETVAAQQRVALVGEPLKLAREFASAVEGRVRTGAASSVESARARAAVAAAQGEVARAQADLLAARARLAAGWGGSATEVASVSGVLRLPADLPAESAWSARLVAHPRLELQRAVIASRRAALEVARSQAAPDVTIGGGLRFLREGSDAGFVAGVSVPLPGRNRNQGNIRAARETLAGAEQNVRAIELELRTELSAAWQQAAAAHATAQSLLRDALPATEEAHAIVRRAYDEGQLPLIDVLDAQRALISLRRELFELEVSYALAHVRVEALVDARFPATSTLLSLP